MNNLLKSGLGLVAACASLVVLADFGPVAPAPAGSSLEASLAALGREVLAMDEALYREQPDGLRSESDRIKIYVGVDGKLNLRKATVRIDEQAPVVYEFSDADAALMRQGGSFRLLDLPIEPGEHRLRAELIAREVNPQPMDPRAVRWVDTHFTKAGSAIRTELVLHEPLFGRAELVQREWGPSPDERREELSHPDLRYVLYLMASGQCLRAAADIGHLMASAGAHGTLANLRQQAIAGTDGKGSCAVAMPRPAEPVPAAPVAAFNAAVAALESSASAEAELARIGALDANDAATLTLKDRANLLLGYHYLRTGKGDRARDVLAHVRSPGPWGNQALLGFGWAFLVGEGGAQAAAPLPVLDAKLASERPMLPRRAEKDRVERLRSATVPWTELVGRDALDPAAQEGMLALSWALQELGAYSQALTFYERSSNLLEAALAQLRAATAHIESGQLAAAVTSTESGWDRDLARLPYSADTAYIQVLLPQATFLQPLQRYRRLHEFMDLLAPRAAAIGSIPQAADLRARLDVMNRALRVDLEASAVSLLRAEQQRAERYLAETQFMLARTYDRGLPPSPNASGEVDVKS
jgi:tetratricopeptide (TPR) repeat protein